VNYQNFYSPQPQRNKVPFENVLSSGQYRNGAYRPDPIKPKPVMGQILNNPEKNTAFYMDELDRFNHDFANYDKMKRFEEQKRREAIYEKHRIE